MKHKKGYLITECSHEIQINEGTGADKALYVTGIFSSFGRRNNNGRVYEEKIMKREVDKVLEKVSRKCLWGELGHPPNPEINMDKIALKVEALEWNGQDLYGKAKILDTPQGNIARTLIREGQIGISSRGLGTVSEDGSVNENFNLITWDLVTDPSNNPSWVRGLYEGKQWDLDEVVEEEFSIQEAQEEYFKYLQSIIRGIKL